MADIIYSVPLSTTDARDIIELIDRRIKIIVSIQTQSGVLPEESDRLVKRLKVIRENIMTYFGEELGE
jgi:hypothetical protein